MHDVCTARATPSGSQLAAENERTARHAAHKHTLSACTSCTEHHRDKPACDSGRARAVGAMSPEGVCTTSLKTRSGATLVVGTLGSFFLPATISVHWVLMLASSLGNAALARESTRQHKARLASGPCIACAPERHFRTLRALISVRSVRAAWSRAGSSSGTLSNGGACLQSMDSAQGLQYSITSQVKHAFEDFNLACGARWEPKAPARPVRTAGFLPAVSPRQTQSKRGL